MRTLLSIAALFVWSLSCATVATADCREAASLAKRGAEAMERNNRAEGVSLFLEAYRKCEQNPAFAFNIGMAYAETKNYAEAEKYPRIAVGQKGDNPVWFNNSHGLFTYLFLKGLRGEADGYRGERDDPKNPDNIVTVGEMEHYLKRFVPRYALQMNKTQVPAVVGGDPEWPLTRLR